VPSEWTFALVTGALRNARGDYNTDYPTCSYVNKYYSLCGYIGVAAENTFLLLVYRKVKVPV